MSDLLSAAKAYVEARLHYRENDFSSKAHDADGRAFDALEEAVREATRLRPVAPEAPTDAPKVVGFNLLTGEEIYAAPKAVAVALSEDGVRLLFREAIAWGKTYGEALSTEQCDRKARQLAAKWGVTLKGNAE